MENRRAITDIELVRPDSATRKCHGSDTKVNSRSKVKATKKVSVEDKSHENLEQEYLNMRRKLSLPTEMVDGNAVRHSNDVRYDVRKMREVNRFNTMAGVLADSLLSPSPIDFFPTDELGINHFKQHLVNVKASSKRSKRNNDLCNKQGRRQHLKFKPLYEKHHLDEKETMDTGN